MKIIMLVCLVVFLVACSPVVEHAQVTPLDEVGDLFAADEALEVEMEEPQSEAPEDASVDTEVPNLPVEEGSESVEKLSYEWEKHRFTDIRTEKQFSISDFAGKTVLFESFAVWCPKCTRQQKVFKEMNDEVVHISLNTDPNEDAAAVLAHVERHGFDWLYAISPAEVTKDLIDSFGITIVNAPAVPVVLVCSDGNSRMLPTGHKEISDLEEEISLGC